MRKRPDNLALFLSMSAGILAAEVSYFSLTATLIFSVLLILLFIFIKSIRTVLLIFLCGSFIYLFHYFEFNRTYSLIEDLNGEKISLKGNTEKVTIRSGTTSLTLRGEEISARKKNYNIPFGIRTYLRSKNIERGSFLGIEGRLSKFSHPVNHYQRDSRLAFYRSKINGYLQKPVIIEKDKPKILHRALNSLRDHISSVFDRRLSYRAGKFLSAVMLGKREGIENSDLKTFADSGTIHLLAVSGLHVGFILVILFALKSLFNLKRMYFIVPASAVLFGYAFFTGSSPSVIRAVLMAVILMLTTPLKRKMRFIDIIGTAGMISLIIDPSQIFRTGFILSFTAVISIALIYSRFAGIVQRIPGSGNTFLKYFYESVILSASITIGMVPLVLYFFGRYNFLSILTNVLMIPLTGFVFLIGLLLILIDKIQILSDFIVFLINKAVDLLFLTAEFTSETIFTLIYSPGISITFAAVLMILCVFYIKSYMFKLIFSMTVVIILIFELSADIRRDYIYSFKTLSGGSYYISLNGYNILIAGKLSRSEIFNIINPFLSANNIRNIDHYITYRNWSETESSLRMINSCVKGIISDKDMLILREIYNFTLTKNISGKGLASGSLFINERNEAVIKKGHHNISITYKGLLSDGRNINEDTGFYLDLQNTSHSKAVYEGDIFDLYP